MNLEKSFALQQLKILKDKLKFVCQLMINNQKGFTLLSVLTGIFVMTLLIPLFVSGYAFWMNQKPSINEFSAYEFYVFSKQLEREFQTSDSYAVTGSGERLFMQVEDRTVSYERYNNSIRRRVMGQGHEVTLQHIDNFTFTQTATGLEILAEAEGKSRLQQLVHPRIWIHQRQHFSLEK
jgi:competence protein ComGF